MGRRKKAESHENHERWLVSYADFITLLFAFFVVMFASSQTDKGKAQQVSDSVKKALEEGQIATLIAGILGGSPDDKGKGNAQRKGPGGAQTSPQPVRTEDLAASLEALRHQLSAEIDSGKMQVTMEARGIVVSFREAAFFPSGEASFHAESHASIEKAAEVVKKVPNPIRLEGHTDSIPIHNSKFRSNWELSTARSIAMLELLTNRFSVDSSRLSVAGYADNTPVGANETSEGRARNRRVDIVILNRVGLGGEPAR